VTSLTQTSAVNFDGMNATSFKVVGKQSMLKCRTSDVFRKLKVEELRDCILKGGGAMTKIRKVLGGVSFIAVLFVESTNYMGSGLCRPDRRTSYQVWQGGDD
jgi:hypothetical protein